MTSLLLVMSASSGFAQGADKPLDLTVLSTSEENVQFIVTTGDPNLDTAEDNASDTVTDIADETASADNLSGDISAQDAPEVTSDEITEETLEEVLDAVAQESIIADSTQTDNQPSGRMTRRSIKDVGLASIGISDGADEALDVLDNRLWRGITLPRAMRLIEFVPETASSETLRKMSYHVIARQAVPPKGAAENPAALLTARLDYLARTGRSDGLATIITQLPETDEWQNWHMWKLYYDLMMRDDEKACAMAATNASTSLEPLWQKVNLLCQILTGEEARAAFSADVLKASGLIDDALFFDVIDVLLRRKTKDEIDPDNYPLDNIDMMHLILMDAAHVNIGARQLGVIDAGYGEAANALRYLADDARQSLGMENFRRGLLSSDEAKALFIASTQPAQAPLIAMTRRIEADAQNADSAAVDLFLSLRAAVQSADTISQDGAIDLVEMLLSAIGIEVRRGNGAIWVPLYAPYLSKAMAASDMTKMPSALQVDYAKVMAVAGLDLTPLPTDGIAVLIADYAKIMRDDKMAPKDRIEALEKFELLGLLPLIAQADASEDDWFARLVLPTQAEHDQLEHGARYQSLSMPAMLALGQAAQSGQRAEAVILASHLVAKRDLAQIAPSDHAKIAAYLRQAGLPKTAIAYGNEALMAHMTASFLQALGEGAR